MGEETSALYDTLSSGEKSCSNTHPFMAYWHTSTSCSEWVALLERKLRQSSAMCVLSLGRFSMASVRLRSKDLSASYVRIVWRGVLSRRVCNQKKRQVYPLRFHIWKFLSSPVEIRDYSLSYFAIV